ncbi:metal ABC transporter solute-binding protein, Zn/Mn family [Halioxenophilus aromaticivorans]|uniref:High-affinity zinc uptake system protein ZnuA n=1 Tax=Halioxenophilus aromaticivorans TaxID=1306992 RepID=A0AAV3U910_9ALTE
MKNQTNPNPAGLCLLLISALMLLAAPVRATTVVASIQPVYLLAREVLAPQVQVQRLLPPGVTPHGFQMAVSQRRMLEQADVIVWVGPQLETFLTSVLRNKDNLALASVPALQWPARGSDHSHNNSQKNSHNGQDPHIWLSPANALVMAQAIVEAVGRLEPSLQPALATNLARFTQQLQAQQRQWQQSLQAVSAQPWLLYHDAAQHFEQFFNLRQYQTVTRTPESKPGARYLHQLRQQITPGQCLLVEAYYPTKQADKLAQEFNLRATPYDPLGTQANSYLELISAMVRQVEHCLAPGLATNNNSN